MPTGGKTSLSKSKKKPKYAAIDITKLPPLYKCSCCGTLVQEPQGKFYKVIQNPLYDGNEGFGTICVNCCSSFFDRMREKYKDEKLALLITCSEMGWFFSEKTYLQMKEKDTADISLGEYIKRLNLSQNKNKTFDNYLVEAINNEQFLNSKQDNEEMFEARWTEEEEKNMETVIEIIGYDPFSGYQASDRRYLFSELVKYLDDEEVVDDNYKLSQIIQIVNNNNQIRQYDLIIAQLKPLSDSKDIQALNDLKSKLVVSNDKIAKENEISVKNRSNKDAGKSTLTYLMRDLREKDFDKAEADYYDQLKSAGTRWAAEVSMSAIQKNTFFDENDMREIDGIKRQMVVELQEKVDDLMEEKRQLLAEIQRLKNGDDDEKT